MKQFVNLHNKNLFTISLELYGNVEFVRKLMSDNNITLETNIKGMILNYDETLYNRVVTKPFIPVKPEPLPYFYYKVMKNQTLSDLAIMHYGDASFTYKILKDNDININTELLGLNLKFDKVKSNIVSYFMKNNKIISSVVPDLSGDFSNDFGNDFY